MDKKILVIFDKNHNGILSEGFAYLKLCRDDDEDETTKESEVIQAIDIANMETNEGSQGPNNINQEPEPGEQV